MFGKFGVVEERMERQAPRVKGRDEEPGTYVLE